MNPKILTSVSTAVLILAITQPAHVQENNNERRNLTPANPVTESATTGSAQKNFDVEDSKQIVQESSQRIVKLVRRRPVTIIPDEDQRLVQEGTGIITLLDTR